MGLCGGVGTSRPFWYRCAVPDTVAPAPAPAPSAAPTIIWIVNDLRSEVEALRSALPAAYTIEAFDDGPQMLKHLGAHPAPDVLVLEQWLRGPSGVDICLRLRDSPATVGLPILLLTVPVDDAEIVQGLEAGADDYLIKPFSVTILTARIASLVRVKRLRERAERAEQQARIERDRFHALIEQSGDAVIAADEHGTLQIFNPEAQRQLGVTAAEAMVPGWGARLDVRALDGRPLAVEEKPIYRAVHGEKVEGARWLVYRPDGSVRALTGNASPLRHPDGSPAGAVLSTRDETKRLRLDEEARDRTRLLAVVADVGIALVQKASLRSALQACAQSLVDHLDAAFARIWTLDAAGEVLELQASAGMYTHLDGAHGRVPVGALKIGTIASTRRPHLTNAVISDPRVGDQVWAAREGMVAFAGYPLLVEDRLVGVMALFARRPLGEATLGVLASAANAVALAIETRRSDEASRRSEAWLATTLRSIGDALIATDAAGRVTLMNPVAEQLTGWAAAQARGRLLEDIFVIVNEETRAPVESPVAKVRREGAIVGLANHTVLRSRSGAEFDIDDSAAPIRDAQGGIEGVVMVFRDVSAKRREETARQMLAGQVARLLDRAKAATAEVEAQRSRLTRLLTQAPFAICVLRGPGHVFELMNPLYQQVVGRDPSILGKPLREAFPELAGQGIYERLDRVYATREPFVGTEIPVKMSRRGDGVVDEGIFNFVYQAMVDGEGQVEGVIVSGVEVTEQVKARREREARGDATV